jgi:hypothetical protein
MCPQQEPSVRAEQEQQKPPLLVTKGGLSYARTSMFVLTALEGLCDATSIYKR